MATLLTGIVQDNTACIDLDGGLLQSYAIDLLGLNTVTWGAGDDLYTISAITLSGATIVFAKFVYVDDETAYYSETGDRPSRNKHIFTCEAFMKFEGITPAKTSAIMLLLSVCAQFWLHVTLSGTILIQGIEKDGGASGWKRPRQTAKPTVTRTSGTGAEIERYELFIRSQQKTLAETSLTTDAIEALTGV